MITISPKQAYDEILACISVGLVPKIEASPGVGKSSIVAQLAKDHNLKLLDLRLSQCTPEDLQGFPMRSGNKATFTPFDIFPLEGEEVPEGYAGWLLFLDEITSATKPVQAAAYKLILDRMVGSYKLHPYVAIVAAGNKATDKAVVSQMSTALQSRLIHYEMNVDSTQWIEHATREGFDHRIVGFIGYMPNRLMDFRPDHQDKTFPCPRTWEFLSRLIKGHDVTEDHAARVSGAIGEGVATEFITFAQEYDRLPRIDAIVAAPKTIAVPKEMSTKFATISMLVEHINKKNIEPVLDYVTRFDLELQILFFRAAVVRAPDLRTDNKRFQQEVLNMVRYIQ
jgi:hypothetical protein